MVMKEKGFAPIIMVIAVLVLGGIVGIFYLSKQTNTARQPQLASYQQPIVASQTAPSSAKQQDPTSNWKTYTNTQLNISFKYPSDWVTKPSVIDSETLHGVIALNSPNFTAANPVPATIDLTYYDNPEQLSLKDFEQKNTGTLSGYTPGVYDPTGAELNVAGTLAYFIHNPICEPVLCDRYVLQSKDKIYLLTTYYNDKESQNVQNQQKVLDQILSTFRFADQVQTVTSTWKTYSSATYNYLIKYPKNYTVSDIAGVYKDITPLESKCIKEKVIMNNGCNISIALYSSEGLSLEDFIVKHPRYAVTYGDKTYKVNFSKYTFNSYDAMSSRDEVSRTIYLLRKETIFVIDSSINEGDFAILSTFKFTQ